MTSSGPGNRHERICATYDLEAKRLDGEAKEHRRWATTADDPKHRETCERKAREIEERATRCRERARESRLSAQRGEHGPVARSGAREVHNAPLRDQNDRRAAGAREAFGFGKGSADRTQFGNGAPEATYYRVTARGGSAESPWCFTEREFAQFTTDGRFDEKKWRAWAAVRPEWQGKAAEVHVIHVDRDKPVVAHSGLASAQDREKGSKVAFMGSGQQTYLERASVRRTETWSVHSPELQRRVREIEARHPSAGKLEGRRPQAVESDRDRSLREQRKNAIQARARFEAGARPKQPEGPKKS